MSQDVYFYFKAQMKDKFIELLKKYDVGCKDSETPCVGIYTFKKNHYEFSKGDTIFHFTMDDSVYKSEDYSIGLRLFEFRRVESEIAVRLLKEENDEIVRRIISGDKKNDRRYKDFQYIKYRMYESLPFTDDEYYFIDKIEEYDFNELKNDLAAEGSITLSDITDFEEIGFEANPPEAEYMERINSLFALIDNELESFAPFPEDEKIKVCKLDLSIIKKEIKEIAADNGLTIKVNAKGLEVEICEIYSILKPLYMKELKDFYNYYYYDNESFKIKIARELRKKETNTYY